MNSYSKFMGRRLVLSMSLLLFAATTLIECSKKDIPVEELARARKEIEMAEAQNPADEAIRELDVAKQALIEGHGQLEEANYEAAATQASLARVAAIQSRLTSSPRYGVGLQDKSSEELSKAEEAFAETLARDDYESAQALHQEGSAALADAEQIQVSAENRAAPLSENSPAQAQLTKYQEAFTKFTGATEASQRARSVALSQKDDLVESAAAVESMLGKAKEFGIEKYDEPGYRNTAALVTAIHEDLDTDKLKSANEKIVGAETQASALLETAKKGKAQDLHAEAESAVKAAQADFDKATAKLSAADKVKYGEYLKAAGEAQASSQDRLNDGMYEESIAESREVIRLSMMVREGSSLSARDLAKLEEERKLRESNLTDNTSTNGTVDDQKSDVSIDSTETKESYKVEKTKPAESLWRISAKKYGKGKLWPKIYDANRDKIKDPNKIYPGQEFVIPAK